MYQTCKRCVNRITGHDKKSYCKMQKSIRSDNGFKPIKASSLACLMYKKKNN